MRPSGNKRVTYWSIIPTSSLVLIVSYCVKIYFLSPSHARHMKSQGKILFLGGSICNTLGVTLYNFCLNITYASCLYDSVWIIEYKSIYVAWNVHRKRETKATFHSQVISLRVLNQFLLSENTKERVYGTLIKFIVQSL